MSEFKLILADIDGTILPAGHHQVSERTTAALEAALDAGTVSYTHLTLPTNREV